MTQITQWLFVAVLAVVATVVAQPISDHAARGDVDYSCNTFSPEGSNSTSLRINFYDNNPTDQPTAGPGFHAPTLPANASLASPWSLAPKHAGGAAFTIKACTVPALGLTSPTTQSSCADFGCYIAYTNYVQVQNPVDGRCLTATAYGSSVSKLRWKPCEASPKTRDQWFQTYQQVQYAPAYAAITGYGSVDFANIQQFVAQGPFLAWALDRANNRTIEVIQFDYTQDGLSASVLPYA